MIEEIDALAKKQISLCANAEELRKVEKFWKRYFAEMNKWIAGKREEPPYLDEISI